MKSSKAFGAVMGAAAMICLLVGGCEKKNSGGSTSGGGGTPSGAQSIPGKARESAIKTREAVTAKNQDAADAADSINDTATGAWAELRSKAVTEGRKRLEGVKKKFDELQATNPQAYTQLVEKASFVTTKLDDLKKAGADAWQPIADEVREALDWMERTAG